MTTTSKTTTTISTKMQKYLQLETKAQRVYFGYGLLNQNKFSFLFFQQYFIS